MIFSKVAFPKEHGSWGFVLEPLILSLIVAFTLDGLFLALATFFMFLSNQPLKVITNKSASKKFKSAARIVLFFYLLIAIILLIYLTLKFTDFSLILFSSAIFILLIYKIAELKKLSRNIFVELFPIFSMTLFASTIVMIDSTFSFNPIIFGLLLLSRSVPTVFYINAKVKWSKGFKFSVLPTHLLNGGFLLFIFYAGFNSLLPMLSILGMLMLTARSIIGFSKFNFTKSVKQIGVFEFIYGALFVAINGVAFLI